MKKKKKTDKKWIATILICAFLISAALSFVSELIIPNTQLVISILLVIIFIFLGILFDIIGVAVTTSKEEMFHSMASKQLKGAKQAIAFIKNKDKVSSFCNDVIGDICGVISGSCGLTIALKLSSMFHCSKLGVTVIVTSLISALTIGGKAVGKTFAVTYSNQILYQVAKVISIFQKDKKKN